MSAIYENPAAVSAIPPPAVKPKRPEEVWAEKTLGTPEQFAKLVGWRNEVSGNAEWKFTVITGNNDHARWYDYTLSIPGTSQLIKFTIMSYPHCCAMAQLVGFSYHQAIKEEQLHELLDLVIASFEMDRLGMYWRNHRLLIAMVQSGQSTEDALVKTGRTQPLNEYVVKDQTAYTMQYNHFYTWFIKQEKSKTISCMHNLNTDNRIHLIESIFLQPK